jgi:MFS family permease
VSDQRSPLRQRARQLLKEAANWGELRKSPYGMKPAVIFAAIFFFQSFDTRTFGAAGPEIARDLDISISTIIGLTAIVSSISLFGAIYAGYLADRHRRVPMVAASAFLSGVMSIFSSRARSTMTLGVPRVADDVSSVLGSPATFSLLADYYPARFRGRVFAMLGTVISVASFVSLGAVGFFIVQWGWRTTTVIFAIPLVVIGLFAFVALKEPVRGYFERKEFGAEEAVALTEARPP